MKATSEPTSNSRQNDRVSHHWSTAPVVEERRRYCKIKNPFDDTMNHSKIYNRLKYIFVVFIMSSNNFFMGCSVMFTSVLFGQLRDSTSTIKLKDNEASWIASFPYLMSPPALLIVGVITDKIGRKKALQIAFVPIIVSYLILAYSNSYETILFGRIVGGLMVGSGSCKYVYAAEICPPNRRQFLFSVFSLLIGIGTMTVCVFAMFLHWQTMSMILAVMSSGSLAALFVLPESPVWLRAHDRVQEAERAEKWFGLAPPVGTSSATAVDDDNDKNDCNGEAATTVDRQDTSSPSFWSLYTRRNVWMPTFISLAYFACQQGSGMYVILSYSNDILRDFRVEWDGNVITCFMSVSQMVGCVAFTLMYNVKRKTMAVVSFGGMAAFSIVILTYSYVFPNTERPFGDLVVSIAFIMYMFFTVLGAVTLPWSLVSEIFPRNVAGTMNGVTQTIVYVEMFAVIKTYPSIKSLFGIENVWLIYTTISILGVLFCIYILPETKGISLDEILEKFESPKKISQINSSVKHNYPIKENAEVINP